jgi:hypothetical protein
MPVKFGIIEFFEDKNEVMDGLWQPVHEAASCAEMRSVDKAENEAN